MTKQNKIKAITNKVCELLKGTDLDPNRINNCCKFDMIRINIGLVDILAAMSILGFYQCNREGNFTLIISFDLFDLYWILDKPLTEQPEETINFLFEIFKEDK